MLRAIHLLLVLAYALLPVGMLWSVLGRRNRNRRVGPVILLMILFLIGIGLGILLVLLNVQLINLAQPASFVSGNSIMGGTRIIKVSAAQIDLKEAGRLIYFVIGALCLIRLVDRLTFRGIFKLARVPLDQWARPLAPNQSRALLCLFAQRL